MSSSKSARSGAKRKGAAKGGKAASKRSPAHLIAVPVSLALAAVLLGIFFIPRGERGSVGGWIDVFFRYLFGGARYLLPIFFAYAAIFWGRFYRARRLPAACAVQTATFLAADALFCYFPYVKSKEPPLVTWQIAADPSSRGVGGGVVGNFLGEGLVSLVGFVAGGILLILGSALLLCFFFGWNPFTALASAFSRAGRRGDARREARRELQGERPDPTDAELRARERERLLAERERRDAARRSREAARAAREERAANRRDERARARVADPTQPYDPAVPLDELPDTPVADEPEEREPPFDTPLPNGASPAPPRRISSPEESGEDTADSDGTADSDALTDGDGADDVGAPEDDDGARDLVSEAVSEIFAEGDLPPERAPEDPELLQFAEEFAEGDDERGDAPHPYRFPPLSLLKKGDNPSLADMSAEIAQNSRKLEETLASFKVSAKVVSYSRGPTVTRYELSPDKGVRVRSIANLVDDIALSLAAEGVRIEAPIPGKSAVGVEVPNKCRETVYLRTLFEDPRFSRPEPALGAALGVNVGGEPVFMDLAKMPHLLIAGTTGSGKSVCMNCLILSLLYKYTPDDVKMILIDPKKVEFKIYNGLPHLITPVVTEAKKAAGALAWAVNEMERRYELIETVGVRDIKSYNKEAREHPEDLREQLPYLVLFIDELADLMFVASSEVEESICRIAQKGRAAGLHLVIGTQRPSVDVITGLIKANIPSRIAFSLPSQTDSRTVIDIGGAEKLIGSGDMLVAPVGLSKPVRLQGPFVSDEEVEAVATFVKENAPDVDYSREVIEDIEREAEMCGAKGKRGSGAPAEEEDFDGEEDPMLEAAIDLAVETGKISTSLIQRRLSLGYGRSAKIIDRMEKMGIVSRQEGQRPRTTLLTPAAWAERKMGK